jgi:hypothetical protein
MVHAAKIDIASCRSICIMYIPAYRLSTTREILYVLCSGSQNRIVILNLFLWVDVHLRIQLMLAPAHHVIHQPVNSRLKCVYYSDYLTGLLLEIHPLFETFVFSNLVFLFSYTHGINNVIKN